MQMDYPDARRLGWLLPCLLFGAWHRDRRGIEGVIAAAEHCPVSTTWSGRTMKHGAARPACRMTSGS